MASVPKLASWFRGLRFGVSGSSVLGFGGLGVLGFWGLGV